VTADVDAAWVESLPVFLVAPCLVVPTVVFDPAGKPDVLDVLALDGADSAAGAEAGACDAVAALGVVLDVVLEAAEALAVAVAAAAAVDRAVHGEATAEECGVGNVEIEEGQ
jgi:hypothetical protein